MENAITEIHRSAGFITNGIGLVVGVRRIQSVKEPFFGIGFAIAIGVTGKPNVRRLDENNAVLVKLESSRAV